jgi:hypothetical protein
MMKEKAAKVRKLKTLRVYSKEASMRDIRVPDIFIGGISLIQSLKDTQTHFECIWCPTLDPRHHELYKPALVRRTHHS